MVIEVVIQKRLEKIVEYLTLLRAQQPVPFERFAKVPEHYALVERFLHLAVEACIDVGAHIVSQKKLGDVDVMRDIPKALRDANIIDVQCAETFLSMIGFRNILVHDYTKIDRALVYQVLQHKLEDLEKLSKIFSKFI